MCSVRTSVQDAHSASACVCEEKDCHRPGRLWPEPGDSVKYRQSNSARSGERSGGYYNQQRRKPLRHLGLSRGDWGCAFKHTCLVEMRLYSKDICERPKTNLNLFSSNNHEQTYESRVANLTSLHTPSSTTSNTCLVDDKSYYRWENSQLPPFILPKCTM